MRKIIALALFLLGLGFAVAVAWAQRPIAPFDSIVVDFREDISSQQLTTLLEDWEGRYHHPLRLNSAFSIEDHIYLFQGDRKTLWDLRWRQWTGQLGHQLELWEPNYIYQGFTAPNDPDYGKQWNLRAINVEQAWTHTQGKGMTVAVIDTGVTRVPDLRGTEFVEGYDFVNDQIPATDDVGHGTHVAGTIAQTTNNNYGVAGIAYQAKIMPLKVLGPGGGTVADIAEAIRFAADHHAQVINLSLGGTESSRLMKEAIRYAYDRGVVLVAAAGNEGAHHAAYPARYPEVISVAALDAAGQKADYSNYGAGVDLAAPGGGDGSKILQETINPATGEALFAEYQGTSMAAPHVAGTVALLKAVGVEKPGEVLATLQQSARKVKDDPLNYYGAGQLDAGAAVDLALKGHLSFQDFLRWLRDNGYLNPWFWLDGGAVAFLPKLLMVLGSYLLAWFLRSYLPARWSWQFQGGLVLGSVGLFPLRGVYLGDLPQWPLRLLGSSIPELGGAIQGSGALNPIFASVAVPFGLALLLGGHPQGRAWVLGIALGMGIGLGVSGMFEPQVWLLGSGAIARSFLFTNAVLCVGLIALLRGEVGVSRQ